MAFSRSSWLRRRIYWVRNCGNVGVRYALYLRGQDAGKQQAQDKGNQSAWGIGPRMRCVAVIEVRVARVINGGDGRFPPGL